jgi:hypothetical protein
MEQEGDMVVCMVHLIAVHIIVMEDMAATEVTEDMEDTVVMEVVIHHIIDLEAMGITNLGLEEVCLEKALKILV